MLIVLFAIATKSADSIRDGANIFIIAPTNDATSIEKAKETISSVNIEKAKRDIYFFVSSSVRYPVFISGMKRYLELIFFSLGKIALKM